MYSFRLQNLQCFVQQMHAKLIEPRVILTFIDGKIHYKHLDINGLSVFQQTLSNRYLLVLSPAKSVVRYVDDTPD